LPFFIISRILKYMNRQFSYKFYSSTNLAWQAMYEEVLGAIESVYWEIYTFVDDQIGNKFIDLLCDKARQGVDVKIIVDGLGSFNLSRLAMNRLKASGVEVLIFNSMSPSLNFRQWWTGLWLRDHCKVLIVDGETSFVGGVNVQSQMQNWDDIYLKLNGKVVRWFGRYFARKYIICGGQRSKVRHLLHPKLNQSLQEVKGNLKFLVNIPYLRKSSSPFRSFYHQAIATAKNSFNLLTPYYAPDPKFLELIYKASRRGVKINIIMPFKNDIKLMHYVARAFYAISKKAGASFYFLSNFNHGKAVTVDDRLGMVGSANLTKHSLFKNHETGVSFTDELMVRDLNSILDKWKNQADPLLEEDFRRPSWTNKFKTWWVEKIKNKI